MNTSIPPLLYAREYKNMYSDYVFHVKRATTLKSLLLNPSILTPITKFIFLGAAQAVYLGSTYELFIFKLIITDQITISNIDKIYIIC